MKKKEDVSPLQNLFKYFNQPFKDISWPYTSTKEIKQNNRFTEEQEFQWV